MVSSWLCCEPFSPPPINMWWVCLSQGPQQNLGSNCTQNFLVNLIWNLSRKVCIEFCTTIVYLHTNCMISTFSFRSYNDEKQLVKFFLFFSINLVFEEYLWPTNPRTKTLYIIVGESYSNGCLCAGRVGD